MHVVLPVKRFAEAKTRLAGFLSAEQRAGLAQAMLEDVLDQLAEGPSRGRVVLVSGEPALERIAADHHAELLPEGDRQGLNAALEQALGALAARGIERVLVLHADLPLLDRAELRSILAHAEADVVLVPDRSRQGTNGLVCSLPLRLALQYGPRSFLAHREAASARGLSFRTESLPSLALDVDTEADVDEVLAVARRDPTLTSRRTVGLLRSLVR